MPARLTVGAGLLLIGAGALTQGTLDAGSTGLSLAPGLIPTGLGVGTAVPALTSAAMAYAPPRRAGMTAGAVNTARQLGYALGIAVVGILFQSGSAAGSPTSGLNEVYWASAVSGVLAGLLVLAVVRGRRPAGAEPEGSQARR
ncbi:MFS transporter [Sinosporangium siamense]|uniref:MFS transporter n=1 Tax=Sinosporangium siamense TaxID=1367973 RepID=A0A919RL27_9ACTN|nr:MFS transporter [Sinosporangium siamense]GII94061.1 hypothetical protein Ssi02_42920 [Sinosporangium siamense]